MKPLPDNARTRNISPPHARREHCRQCNDTGWVVVQTRPADPKHPDGEAFDEMGPCPFCELGKANEFPDPEKQQKSPPVVPPWGSGEGFWRGRDDVTLTPHGSGPPLPLEENRRRLAELRARLGFVGRDLPGEETPVPGRASGRLVKERKELPDERWFQGDGR